MVKLCQNVLNCKSFLNFPRFIKGRKYLDVSFPSEHLPRLKIVAFDVRGRTDGERIVPQINQTGDRVVRNR